MGVTESGDASSPIIPNHSLRSHPLGVFFIDFFETRSSRIPFKKGSCLFLSQRVLFFYTVSRKRIRLLRTVVRIRKRIFGIPSGAIPGCWTWTCRATRPAKPGAQDQERE